MTDNQKKLRGLMAGNESICTYEKLADVWGVSKSTVHAYLKPDSSMSHRPIPDGRLKELEQIIGNAKT